MPSTIGTLPDDQCFEQNYQNFPNEIFNCFFCLKEKKICIYSMDSTVWTSFRNEVGTILY